MASKRISLNHLYENVDLYQLIFGQPVSEDVVDAEGACAIVEHWLCDYAVKLEFDLKSGHFKRLGRSVTQEVGLHVCEVMSGPISKHKYHFMRAFAGHVTSWNCLDRNQEGATFDLTQDTIPKRSDAGRGSYDVVAAFCYSASGILDGYFPASYLSMVNVFKNVCEALRPNGLFVLDMPDNLEAWTYGCTTYAQAGEIHTERVPNGSALRHALDLPLFGGDVRLEYKADYEYDRAKSIIYCYFDGPIKIMSGSTLVQSVTVKMPFTWRAWTESDLLAIAALSGFKEDVFYPLTHSKDSGNIQYQVRKPIETEYTHTESNYKNLVPRKLGFVKA